jgi:hypothetical protein
MIMMRSTSRVDITINRHHASCFILHSSVR